MKFTRGLKDGLPIALGYVSVAIAYAVQAVNQGFPFWFPILVSGTNFTGTGQFVGTNLIAAGANLGILLATILVINIRYTLMSFALAQKMEDGFPLWKRAIIAFGVTDENFAVAVRQPHKLTFPYLLGLMSCSYFGWLGGTALGAGISQLLETLLAGGAHVYYEMLMSALSIALYAMFVAIILPPSRDDKRVLLLVLISIAASCIFYFVPFLADLPAGLNIIICSVACTAVIAAVFPHKEEQENTQEEEEK